MTTMEATTRNHKVVSEEEWLEARKALLTREKEFTRLRDELNLQRLELPWVRVDKTYTFDGPDGQTTLSNLFDGRSQLLVYHFMFGPEWEEGCPGCSFLSDHFDGARQHFEHHDVSLAAVSRAPRREFEPFKKRMGWTFNWVSSSGNDFNHDYHASYTREELDRGPVFHNFVTQKLNSEEQPGLSAFYKDKAGDIFHTYSTYERGLEMLVGAYAFLDLAPLGRNETGAMDWMRHHDKYEE